MVENQESSISTDSPTRDRSPQFPFISLQKAIERAQEFEGVYKRSAGRIANVLPVWGYAVKSSGGAQTVGALKAFGLIDDEGAGADRKIKLTELAQHILKDERPGKRQEAIKEAALKPRAIAEHWAIWGTDRPPDPECISELTLERSYTEEAAKRFLRVYDDTIGFAGLIGEDSNADKPTDKPKPNFDIFSTVFGPSIQTPQAKVTPPMQGQERVVFAQELDAPQTLRLIVTGPVDDAVLDALDSYVQHQRGLLQARAKRADTASQQHPQRDNETSENQPPEESH
jgi:hypothetical protein